MVVHAKKSFWLVVDDFRPGLLSPTPSLPHRPPGSRCFVRFSVIGQHIGTNSRSGSSETTPDEILTSWG